MEGASATKRRRSRVVRARRVRVVLACVVLTLASVGGLLDLLSIDNVGRAGPAVLELAATGGSLAALAQFCRSDWCAWPRTGPSPREGASVNRLMVIAVLVGALGGYVGLVDGGITTQVNVSVG